ncbi:MAG: hypothetical protein WB777_13350 [Mycobacterium sp.]
MAAVATLPSLSQLLDWPSEHLTDAAEHWEAVAERNYGLANQVWQDASSVDWQGNAADALRTATHSDMIAASAAADQLQTAAKVARSGAADLYAARSRLQYALDDAHAAGFEVDEEGSVFDRSTGGSAAQRAARHAQAEALSANIRQRAGQLVAADQQVAGKVTAAVAGIRDTFPSAPAPEGGGVQAVDNHTFKQDPVTPDPNADSPWKDHPPPRTLDEVRDALRQLPRGRNAPHRELRTPEEIQEFYEWLTRNSVGNLPPFAFPRRQLEDGTVIEMRPNSSSGGPVIEVKPPGAKEGPKVHLPLPFVDDPPQLPPTLDHPRSTPMPPAPGHPLPAPLGPPQFFDPADVPPWLKDPSPPGFTISPVQRPPAFGWDQPDTAPPPAAHPAPSSSGCQSWLPEIRHDLSEGGKAVFGWVVVGGVLVWTLLSGAGQSGGAALP